MTSENDFDYSQYADMQADESALPDGDDAPELRYGTGEPDADEPQDIVAAAAEFAAVVTEVGTANGRAFERKTIINDGSAASEDAKAKLQQLFKESLEKSRGKGSGFSLRHNILK